MDTSFLDEKGRQWTVRLNVGDLYKFCREEGMALDALSPVKMKDGKWTMGLRVDQLLKLAYVGTRYQARAQAKPETLEEFLEALEGPSFISAQTAAVLAIVSFFLKVTPKQIQESANGGDQNQSRGNGAQSIE